MTMRRLTDIAWTKPHLSLRENHDRNRQHYLGCEKRRNEKCKKEIEEDPAEAEYPIEGVDYYVHDTRNDTPYKITEEEYSEDMCEFFDKITLEYYLDDEMLLTEDGYLVDDIYKTIGRDWEDDLIEDGDETYVRNELVGADYLILAKDGRGIDVKRGDYYDDL